MHVLYSPCPQPCIRPVPTHAFTRNSSTPIDMSSVGSLFLSPGSWCVRFCCALQKSVSQSYVSSGSSTVSLMATSSKRTYAILTPRAPVPVADHCQPVPLQETLKHSSVSVSVGSPGSGVQWGLILNVNSPSYSFAGASPLPLNVGYLLIAPPVSTVLLGFL